MPRAVTVTSCVFVFSSRRRHTRFDCDWSSDVCSSDLHVIGFGGGALQREENRKVLKDSGHKPIYLRCEPEELWKRMTCRSEERRVGKECRSRWSPYD